MRPVAAMSATSGGWHASSPWRFAAVATFPLVSAACWVAARSTAAAPYRLTRRLTAWVSSLSTAGLLELLLLLELGDEGLNVRVGRRVGRRVGSGGCRSCLGSLPPTGRGFVDGRVFLDRKSVVEGGGGS